MTLTEKKQKLISDFRETSKVATSDLEKLKIAQSKKADLKEFKEHELESKKILNEAINEFKIQSEKLKTRINTSEKELKTSFESYKVTYIDGGEI